MDDYPRGDDLLQWLDALEEDRTATVNQLSDESWYQTVGTEDAEAEMDDEEPEALEDGEGMEDFFTPYSPVDEFFDDLLLDDIVDSQDATGHESLMGTVEPRGAPQTIQWKGAVGVQQGNTDLQEPLFTFSAPAWQPVAQAEPNASAVPGRSNRMVKHSGADASWNAVAAQADYALQQQHQQQPHQQQHEQQQQQHQQLNLQQQTEVSTRKQERAAAKHEDADPSYSASYSARHEHLDRKTKQSASERRVDFYRAELKRQTNNRAKASHFKVGEVRSRSPYFLSFVWRDFINKLYGIHIPVFKDPETDIVDTPAALQGKIRKNRMPWKNLDMEKALRQAMDEKVKKSGPAPGTRRYRGDIAYYFRRAAWEVLPEDVEGMSEEERAAINLTTTEDGTLVYMEQFQTGDIVAVLSDATMTKDTNRTNVVFISVVPGSADCEDDLFSPWKVMPSPPPQPVHEFCLVALLGLVEVRTSGVIPSSEATSEAHFIVPSGLCDGTGVAVSQSQWCDADEVLPIVALPLMCKSTPDVAKLVCLHSEHTNVPWLQRLEARLAVTNSKVAVNEAKIAAVQERVACMEEGTHPLRVSDPRMRLQFIDRPNLAVEHQLKASQGGAATCKCIDSIISLMSIDGLYDELNAGHNNVVTMPGQPYMPKVDFRFQPIANVALLKGDHLYGAQLPSGPLTKLEMSCLKAGKYVAVVREGFCELSVKRADGKPGKLLMRLMQVAPCSGSGVEITSKPSAVAQPTAEPTMASLSQSLGNVLCSRKKRVYLDVGEYPRLLQSSRSVIKQSKSATSDPAFLCSLLEDPAKLVQFCRKLIATMWDSSFRTPLGRFSDEQLDPLVSKMESLLQEALVRDEEELACGCGEAGTVFMDARDSRSVRQHLYWLAHAIIGMQILASARTKALTLNITSLAAIAVASSNIYICTALSTRKGIVKSLAASLLSDDASSKAKISARLAIGVLSRIACNDDLRSDLGPLSADVIAAAAAVLGSTSSPKMHIAALKILLCFAENDTCKQQLLRSPEFQDQILRHGVASTTRLPAVASLYQKLRTSIAKFGFGSIDLGKDIDCNVPTKYTPQLSVATEKESAKEDLVLEFTNIDFADVKGEAVICVATRVPFFDGKVNLTRNYFVQGTLSSGAKESAVRVAWLLDGKAVHYGLATPKNGRLETVMKVPGCAVVPEKLKDSALGAALVSDGAAALSDVLRMDVSTGLVLVLMTEPRLLSPDRSVVLHDVQIL